MHYRNGREANNGDKVMLIPSYGAPVVGILYNATAGNDFCNGKIAPISNGDACPNLKECLHLDDALEALAEKKPEVVEPAPDAVAEAVSEPVGASAADGPIVEEAAV